MIPRYLTAREVADYLSISRNMVDILVDRKVLPKPIMLTSRLPRWDREAIDAALASGTVSVQRGRAASDIIIGRITDGLAQGGASRPKAPAGRH